MLRYDLNTTVTASYISLSQDQFNEHRLLRAKIAPWTEYNQCVVVHI
jgi:hypothetical protein